MGQDKDSLVSERVGELKKKSQVMQKQSVTISRSVPSQSLSNGNLGKTSPPRSVLLLHITVWDISLVSSGLLCPLPTSCPPPTYSVGETLRRPLNCKQCSATDRTLVTHQHCFGHPSKTQHHTHQTQYPLIIKLH